MVAGVADCWSTTGSVGGAEAANHLPRVVYISRCSKTKHKLELYTMAEPLNNPYVFVQPTFRIPNLRPAERSHMYGLVALLGVNNLPHEFCREMAAFEEWNVRLVQLDRLVNRTLLRDNQ